MPVRRKSQTTVTLLVRHGQTPTTGQVLPGRAPGLHLSEAGEKQAGEVATRLVSLKRRPVALYHSPLERTSETAKPIAELLGLKPRVDRGLIECDFGEWTGAELKSLRKKPQWQDVQFRPSTFRFPGGESFTEMQHRMNSTLERLATRHAGETIICVSHADPIKAAVSAAAGVPLDLFQRFFIAPCSVSAIAAGTEGTFVSCVNSMGSLAEVGIP